MEEGEYVEVKGEDWRSSYNHQRRPDPTLRSRNVIPREKLAVKGNRYFTTDTSTTTLDTQIKDQRKSTEPAVKKFLPKWQ